MLAPRASRSSDHAFFSGTCTCTLSGQDRYLPDKAIDLLDETGARVQLRSMRVGETKTATTSVAIALLAWILIHFELSKFENFFVEKTRWRRQLATVPEEALELRQELRDVEAQKEVAVRTQVPGRGAAGQGRVVCLTSSTLESFRYLKTLQFGQHMDGACQLGS